MQSALRAIPLFSGHEVDAAPMQKPCLAASGFGGTQAARQGRGDAQGVLTMHHRRGFGGVLLGVGYVTRQELNIRGFAPDTPSQFSFLRLSGVKREIVSQK